MLMRSTDERIRRATTLGSDVPCGPFPVRVHSVFRAAVNLRTADGELVTLLSGEAPDCPHGVRLASVENFASLGLAKEAGGVFGVVAISIERSAGRPMFRIDYGSARRLVAQALPPLRGDERRWSDGVALLEALQERAATDLRVAPLLAGASAHGPMGERLTEAALDLGGGVRAGRLDAARDAAARLIGLGPGLTPAGDDFLCGFLAAAYCRCAADPERSPLLARFADAVRELLGQTTEISAVFLRDAIAGRVFRPLTALAEACADAPESGVCAALLQLAAVGHSSGLDAATGFFYGATVWRDSPRTMRRGADPRPTFAIVRRSDTTTFGE